MAEGGGTPEHAAADELLPWYVNGTLSPEEHAGVRRHLEVCETCRRNVSLLSRVEAVVNRPPATPILPRRRPDVLLERIDRAGRAASKWRGARVLAAAASVAIVAAAFLLWPGSRSGAPERSVYETATTAREQGDMEYVMRLQFAPGASAEDRQRVLADVGARDARYDEASGAYQANVLLAAASLDELTRFTRSLEARPEVQSARIVALQLPMQRASGRDDQ